MSNQAEKHKTHEKHHRGAIRHDFDMVGILSQPLKQIGKHEIKLGFGDAKIGALHIFPTCRAFVD